MLRLKRIYETPTEQDGFRILVDRLWPRGVSKQQAQIDQWLKDIAPSTNLRTWFNHAPERFEEFSEKYREELEQNPATTDTLRLLNEHKNITLIYAAKDPKINHAAVLQKFLQERMNDK